MMGEGPSYWERYKRLQGEFSTLVGLFDRVIMRNNVGKTVVMVFRPCQAEGTQSEAAYR